jgi:hypothetical protein
MPAWLREMHEQVKKEAAAYRTSPRRAGTWCFWPGDQTEKKWGIPAECIQNPREIALEQGEKIWKVRAVRLR